MSAPKYAHPPIVEATLEFRISGRISDEDVVHFQQALSKDFIKVEHVTEVVIAISHDSRQLHGPLPTSGNKFKLTSEDGAWIVQVGTSRCSVSNLAPYVGWENFEKRARSVWAVWRSVAGKKEIERLGLRYINRVDIPGNTVKPDEWFNVYPEFPDILGLKANEAQSVIAGMLDQNFGVKVATALVPPALIDHLSLVLDIDAFCVAVNPRGDEEMWAAVSALHDRKNIVFEGCITDKTRNLFQ
jgi:uncharacterized protein (TIGR04255 family)